MMDSAKNWKPRAEAAGKSLMALAEAAQVNYQRLYFASRGLSNQPSFADKVEKVLAEWGV